MGLPISLVTDLIIVPVFVGVFAVCADGCAPIPEAQEVEVDPAHAVITLAGTKDKTAATEFQVHLKAMTGKEVPLAAKGREGDFVFQVGGNENFAEEECAWCVTATNAVFVGGGAHGSLWAVLEFLEAKMGVRWPGEDVIACRESPVLKLPIGKGTWKPAMKMRGVRNGAQHGGESLAPAGRVFMRRMRAGGHAQPKYGHAFTKYWQLYGKDHPEYFAARADGVRAPKGVKAEDLLGNVAVYHAHGGDISMCVTSEGFHAQILKDWEKAGRPEYINLCENDTAGQDSCHCAACTKLDAPPPANVNPNWRTDYADRYVWFGNEILKKARKVRPDVKVCYYAYNATQDAPKKFRPDEASVVGIVPTIFTDAYVSNYVGSWKSVGLEHFFYRPNRHHYYICPYLPVAYAEHFFGLAKYLSEQGAIGFDYDAPSATGWFQWLDRYVLMHLMQDPTKDFAYWEKHYFEAYGAAANDVQAYYRFWRSIWNTRIEPNLDKITTEGKWYNFGRGLVHHAGEYFKEEDFATAEKLLTAAEAKAMTSNEKAMLAHVRKAHDHALLFFRAVTHKCRENTEKLAAFRKANGFPLYTWSEQYFGDVTGMEKFLGKEKK